MRRKPGRSAGHPRSKGKGSKRLLASIAALLVSSILLILREAIPNTVGELLADIARTAYGNLNAGVRIASAERGWPTFLILFVLGILCLVPVLLLPQRVLWLSKALAFGMAVLGIGLLLTVGVAAAAPLLEPRPTSTRTATMTPSPTPDIYGECSGTPGEWPCYVEVLDTNPKDTLTMVARRGYRIQGSFEPRVTRLVCLANLEALSIQFYAEVPPQDRSVWENDPCNYIRPGNLILIPIPPFDVFATPVAPATLTAIP